MFQNIWLSGLCVEREKTMRRLNLLFLGCALFGTVLAMAGTPREDNPIVKPASQVSSYDEDYYNDCVLSNVKPQMEGVAVGAIRLACRHKATPKKCRGMDDHAGYTFDQSWNNLMTLREYCVFKCKESGYWSNKFGECSIG